MKVIVFGATGMVGQGVLRECLLDPVTTQVLTVGRRATGQENSKLREIVHANLLEFDGIESELVGYDACFFCVGTVSMSMPEKEYHHVTYDIPMAVAQALVRLNPSMTFVFLTGAGADSSEQGRVMWARVKGKAENAILKLPFKAAYMFRPAAIQPLNGERSNTGWDFLYGMKSFWWFLRLVAPKYVTTTEELGRAMLGVASRGYSKRILETEDFKKV